MNLKFINWYSFSNGKMAGNDRVGIGTAPLVKLHVQGNGSLLNITNGSNTFLFVNSSGFVGIGTSAPVEELTIGANKVNISDSGDVNATNFYGNGGGLTGILTQTSLNELNNGITQNITDTRASINNNITSVRAEINNNITDVRNSVNLNRTNLLINISSLNTTLGKKLDRGESLTDGSKIANGTDANLLNLNVTLLSVGLVPTNRHNVTIIGTVNISNSSGTGASLFINQNN